MKRRKVWWLHLAVLCVLTAFFVLLFYTDNKYQTPPPYGSSGIIVLNEENLQRNNPIFLIDGWLLTDKYVKEKPVYIGEFSNLQRGNMSVSPHGWARYQLTLRYDGAPRIVSLEFPQLSSYSISLNGAQLASGTGNGRISFLLTSGDHILTVDTSSKAGYYSGMYFPPALGTEEILSQTGKIQNFAYALAVLFPLALAMFTIFLWRTGGKSSRLFGLLCCFYALYMFRYFVFLFSMPVQQYWFLVQNVALYGVCFCVVSLAAQTSDAAGKSRERWQKTLLLLLPLILLVLCALIPILPWAVFIHGRLTDTYYILTFFTTTYFAAHGTKIQNPENRFTAAGCTVFGAGLLINLFFSNLFEPIRFFWQFEWCGLLLVFLFGAMMVSRSRRILRENDMLTNHLEEQVAKRTEEVVQLLEERKAFFSDMAHDLKAPVFATQSYIRAVRTKGVGVDEELLRYLEQAEDRQQELARRLQGLSAVNELDKVEGKRTRISVKELFAEIYAAHHVEAEVQSVYFSVEQPAQDMFLMAQPEKMNILFENLIYNALRATPKNGSIRICARRKEENVCIIVEDTGCGIPEEELPSIFQRFYVGAENRNSGTGLGLYIVHSIVTELGGAITVQSTVGQGTTFRMEFPVI